MEITVNIPNELAIQLRPYTTQLPDILKLGMRQWLSRLETGFSGVTDVLEALAALPAPEEVLSFRPSATLHARISELLEKNRSSSLLPDEQREWEGYQFIEHLVRVAKAHATLRLRGKPAPD